MLPGVDGLTVCRRLRSSPQTAGVAIVMLTAKGEEADVVAGLNAGANDYITKPFSRNVLIARVRAALRNMSPSTGTAAEPEESGGFLRIHNLMIHSGKYLVLVDEEPIELSATEFRVLQTLARKPGWVFTRQQILDAVHGDIYAVTDRAVDVQIVGLRKKLGPAGSYIETVRGVGYRFKE
jgi:two-component system phosphate regulon response regulator PhoB